MDGVLKIIDDTIGREGAYSNHPSDTGGPTRWGVTESVARRNGFAGDMKLYPREMAVAVYLKRYWEEPKISTIGPINIAIAEELFDTGVNMGPAWACLFLQQALNALNMQGKLYADIKEDGDIGPATRAALTAFLKKRGAEGEEVMLMALNVLQGARYFAITGARPKNEDFFYGWLKNRIVL
jgi:lysozyme family protein